ncbi:MAG: ribose 5-phosphate isomerase B [Alphaproteobacteria bacterium CG11_big_fil_rev_8_21_14_0_20_44_7]|nr:MAG: ribose 5-phosphate isomerase B [Alphaproteobacteria bacterium CG11_big_fil_rev_8_21_14_0_20_44_7]
MKKIVFGSDHAGFKLKEKLKAFLEEHEMIDVGTDSEERADYPDFGYKAAEKVANGEADCGIIICGSGIGISIAANRNPKIRCALCRTPEDATLARQHNDANMLALGERLTDLHTAIDIVNAFLTTDFEGGRHAERVDKLAQKCYTSTHADK